MITAKNHAKQTEHVILKVCKNCQKELPLTEFYKRSGYLSRTCKYCEREKSAKWRKDNPDRVQETKAKWMDDNRDRELERTAKWKKNNMDKVLEMNRKWRKNNMDKVLEMKRKWRKDNPDKLREWKEANKDKVVKYKRKAVENLSDYYVLPLIFGKSSLRPDTIPPELIEFKRQQILLQRATKEFNHELKKHKNSN